jgi:Ca-activated chloride channel homolog
MRRRHSNQDPTLAFLLALAFLIALPPLVLLAGCGDGRADGRRARATHAPRTLAAPPAAPPPSPGWGELRVAAAPAAAPRRPRPLEGADIDPAVLLAPEEGGARVAESAAAAIALGDDRPVVRVEVPSIPRARSTTFTFGDGHRGWVAKLPTDEPIPSVAYGDGRVYASGGFTSYALFALDGETGRFDWMRQDLEDNGPTAPLYEDGDLVFNTESCTLIVLDGKTGKKRWTRWLGDPTLAQPALALGLVFASYPSRDRGGQEIGAFALRSGKPVWHAPVDGELLSAPVVASGALYASTIAGSVYRFDGKTGRRLWAKRLRATSAPTVFGDRIVLSRSEPGAAGRLLEAQVVLDAGNGRLLQTLGRAPAKYIGDVPRSLESWPKVWAFEGSRPLHAFGRLVDTMAGVASAADPRTGKLLWRRTDSHALGARSLTPPVVAGSQILFASRKGTLYALDIDTGMTVFAYDLGRPVAASPVVARGWVYLTTSEGSVIGLEVGDRSLDGWRMWGGSPSHNGRAAGG